MAKYIDLPNLKENLTNFLNKKINPIYAKKTEIPSNVSELNNDKSYQTAEEVGQAVTDGVARIVAGAPEDFDTLKEMSDWISSHETSAAAMNSAISDNSVAIANHTSNSDIHVTKAEKTKWNKLDSDLKDGTIIVAEATKATQDAQGNVINETYAKKTEVPQGTVVDDALSSTSTNPVQNKVVKAEFDHVNSNLTALDNSKLKGYTIVYDVPANTGGWHKIAQITGYFNFDLYTTGNWMNQRKSNAHFHIQNINGIVRIVQLSGLADPTGIKMVRMVRVDNNADTWILEEYSTSSIYTETFNFTIAGDVTITPLDGSVDTTTDFKDSVSLDVSDIPTGTVITTSNIDNALSSTSTNPVQNKVVKAEFDKVNSNLSNLQYVAGGKNLFKNYDHYGSYRVVDEPYNGNSVIYSANLWDGAYQSDLILKKGKTYAISAYVKGSGNYYIFCNRVDNNSLATIISAIPLNDEWTKITQVFTPGFDVNKVRFENDTTGGLYISCFQIEKGTTATEYEPYIPSVKMLAEEVNQQKNDLSNLKDGTTPVAKAVADEDGNNIKSTYAKVSHKHTIADITNLQSTLDGKMNTHNPTGTGSFSLNRKYGTDVGVYSFTEGFETEASGGYSHAEGTYTKAIGDYSHTEGSQTKASGDTSHAEGLGAKASGDTSHAEGNYTEASGNYSHAEGYRTTASGDYSHTEGENTGASGSHSHAEGYEAKAIGNCSHAEGYGTEASNCSSHASGKYNAQMTTEGGISNTEGTAFSIGNGTSSVLRSNAFSVQYDGTVKAKSTITASTTADYAEFFEWLDENPNNEDRVGYFVTLDGNRIKIASDNDDYILGIVSGEPFVLGNGDCDTWNGMYLHDEFRRTIYEPAPKVEEVEIKEEREETYIDEKTGEEKIRTVEVVVGHEFKEVEGEFDGTRPKLNPEYDNTQQYISRFDRKEWSPVGMLGVLAVRHDGTAKVNGYVTVNKDGIATACDRNTENSYRVIKANTDSVVEIIFK